MIVTQLLNINDKEYIKSFSDKGYRIYQTETGNVYNSALDIFPAKYTYKETSELRSDYKEFQSSQYEKIIDTLTGQAGDV